MLLELCAKAALMDSWISSQFKPQHGCRYIHFPSAMKPETMVEMRRKQILGARRQHLSSLIQQPRLRKGVDGTLEGVSDSEAGMATSE